MARTYTHAVLALLGAMGLARPSAAQRIPHEIDTVHVVARTDPTVVSATRSFEILTRADLARHASRSLADVLGLALGVDAQQRSPAQADLGLRGSTFNQVVVLVDGVRVSDVQSGHYALDLAVPVAMIERIEILRGTGSAMYGSDAIGGVVNIVTRADSAFGDAATRAGSFGGALARGAFGGAVARYAGAHRCRHRPLERAPRGHRLSHRPGTSGGRASRGCGAHFGGRGDRRAPVRCRRLLFAVSVVRDHAQLDRDVASRRLP